MKIMMRYFINDVLINYSCSEMIMNNYNVCESAVYFLLVFIDGQWRFKIGKAENFINRMKTLNNQFNIGVNRFLYSNYKIPKILPIAVFFTDSIKLTKEIEKTIKYMFYKDLSRVYDNQLHQSREIYDINSEIYDKIMEFTRKYSNQCKIFCSDKFECYDNDIIYFDNDTETAFNLNTNEHNTIL